nr:unnamed protein product [Callosobruchus chinensis]
MKLLTQKLYDISRMHNKLCRIISKLNSSAGLSIFLCLLSTSINLVVLVFLMYLQIFHQEEMKDKHPLSLIFFFWLVTHAFEMGSIISHSVRFCKIANKTPVQLHQLRNKMNLYNVELDGHIQFYSLQLLQQKVCISTLGFFELDYSLMFSTFGGVMTYLVILIQLDASSPNLDISADVLYNSTTSTILP